jgi:hypothetical protein
MSIRVTHGVSSISPKEAAGMGKTHRLYSGWESTAHRCWIRDCRRGGSMSVVGVVYVGYAGDEDFVREEKIELLEEDKWEGEI